MFGCRLAEEPLDEPPLWSFLLLLLLELSSLPEINVSRFGFAA